MNSSLQTPLVRLGNLFEQRSVYAKCEFLAPSGCFKIRGATHLLDHLSREGRTRHLVVPSMGNTALGAAVGAQAFGFSMTGVVPKTIARAKDEMLRALGVELVKIDGGMGRLGCDVVDLDFMAPIAEGRASMGPDQVILGNIDPVRVLRNGEPDEVTAALRECHRQAGPRFIVGAGCEVVRDTPAANLRALVEYAQTHAADL